MNTIEIYCPFTIVIDSAESLPFTFAGLRADARHGGGPLVVNTRWACLGRCPHSTGDYSIDGLVGRVGVERKSIDDAQSTVLGFGERRQRFEQELSNLAKLDAALVVVEGTLGDCLDRMPERGIKSADENRRVFNRSVLAYMQDYRVPWLFCDSRRLAEIATFRFLERFYRKVQPNRVLHDDATAERAAG